jgi:hypothetical protein
VGPDRGPHLGDAPPDHLFRVDDAFEGLAAKPSFGRSYDSVPPAAVRRAT